MSERPRLGISACLCGQAVRYDGRDKHAQFIARVLPRHFDLIAICPEVGVGMTVPRPPMQLEVHGEEVRVRGVEWPELDMTDLLGSFAARQAARYPTLAGYIFKRGSPSCGLDVPLHGEAVPDNARGRGHYAEQLLQRLAPLPAIQEDWLEEGTPRRIFFETAFAHHRYQASAHDPAARSALHRAYAPVLEARGLSPSVFAADGSLPQLLTALATPIKRDIDARMLIELVNRGGGSADSRDAVTAYANGEAERSATVAEVSKLLVPERADALHLFLRPLPDDLETP